MKIFQIKLEKILKKEEYLELKSPIIVLILGIPVLFIQIHNLGFPEYFQLIGNIMLLIGGIFNIFVQNFYVSIQKIPPLKATYFLAFSFLMTFISSENESLMTINALILMYFIIKYITKFLKYPE